MKKPYHIREEILDKYFVDVVYNPQKKTITSTTKIPNATATVELDLQYYLKNFGDKLDFRCALLQHIDILEHWYALNKEVE